MQRAREKRLPFGVTPYYLSLMDQNPAIGYDHAVLAQVLPPPGYVDQVAVEDRPGGPMNVWKP